MSCTILQEKKMITIHLKNNTETAYQLLCNNTIFTLLLFLNNLFFSKVRCKKHYIVIFFVFFCFLLFSFILTIYSFLNYLFILIQRIVRTYVHSLHRVIVIQKTVWLFHFFFFLFIMVTIFFFY